MIRLASARSADANGPARFFPPFCELEDGDMRLSRLSLLSRLESQGSDSLENQTGKQGPVGAPVGELLQFSSFSALTDELNPSRRRRTEVQ